MLSILLVCVNYNSYDKLYNYLNSVQNAVVNCPDMSIKVFIADNSDKEEKLQFSYIFPIDIIKLDNLGYMGGASSILNRIDKSMYTYVIISNVDIIMDSQFFTNLSVSTKSDNIGWIANSIYSSAEGRDKNPKILNRYSKNRMKLFRLMYKYPILYKLYINTLYKRKKVVCTTYKSGTQIYAGHGSFILLTKAFFDKNPIINYPVFLFGEEQYLAEICLQHNLEVRYLPEMIIYDDEHVSTGSLNSEFYFECNYKAMDYIYKTFYNE